jgi:ATP-dependent Clp endopeptidase proteolytic subunit ClpP
MVARLEDLLAVYHARRTELDRQGVYFLGDITDAEAESFSKAILLMAIERQFHPERPIQIFINSGGGSVGAGFAMMEMVERVKRDYKVRVATVITGFAFSMGAIVFQAGDHRTMGPFSTMMLHSSQWSVTGSDERVFKDYARLSNIYQRMIGELFARRTGKHNPRWWTRFIYGGGDRFLTAKEALAHGLTDEVVGEPSQTTSKNIPVSGS